MRPQLETGIAFHRQGRLELAEKNYTEALAEDFDDVDTLYLLGTIYLQNGKPGLAAQLLRQCIQFKKDHFEAWNNLGNSYKAVNKDVDAEACFKQALSIPGKPEREHADIYNNLAALHVNAGSPEKGIEWARKALKIEPTHVDANWNLALMLLETGQYAEGFDLYHWGFKTKSRPDRDYGCNEAYWDGSPGKTLVIWGEQGMGDEIMFASMIEDAAAISEHVIFDCHPRMKPLFEASFSHIKNISIYGTRKDSYIEWVYKHPKIDAKIAMGDLGAIFRRRIEDFPGTPYLKPRQDRLDHYQAKLGKLGGRLKVGISWTGGYMKTRKDFRSIPLPKWEPILTQDCDFISLQYTPDAYNAIAEIEDKLDIRIHHWPSAVQAPDYHETAALVRALDLVITVNTAVHHLSGALGTECWTLTPKAKAWRYFSPDGEHFPWYRSCIQFQQDELMQWDDIINKVASGLGQIVSTEAKISELCVGE